MPLVPRLLRPPGRIGTDARALPLEKALPDSTEKLPAPARKKPCPLPVAVGILLALLVPGTLFGGGVELRDMAMIAGARDNQLVGYGLVVGLAGDGGQGPGLYQAERGEHAFTLRCQHPGRDHR